MKISTLGFALFLYSPLALAYGPCDADAKRLCASQEYHGETEKNCLHFQVEQVQNSLCVDFLRQEESEWRKSVDSFRQVQTSCRAELQKHCAEVAESDRQFKAQQTCLMSERDQLSAGCKTEINRHIRSFQPSIRELP